MARQFSSQSTYSSVPLSNLLVFFLDRLSEFLAKRIRKEMIKRPGMRRDGATFLPRVRGSSESISPATAGKLEQAARQGQIGERPKTIERKLSYEK
jgi:hypothetical protein